MHTLIKLHYANDFWIDYYGAYNINPKHLVFRICVKTDRDREKLSANNTLHDQLKDLPRKYDYPGQARPFVHIGFESQETVDRESGGNWFYHFK